MSVSLYTGHVGSGKSYEVVKNVILPALSKGRVVVSNIDGLDQDKLIERAAKASDSAVGRLVVVDRNDIRNPAFFPKRRDGAEKIYDPSEFVPLGALVVVDEASWIWGPDKAIPGSHLEFFREHRHITADDGTACDLVVISQTVDGIHRSLKGLVEFSIDCRQLKVIGSNRSYTTTSFQQAKRTKAARMGTSTQRYDRSIFKLYKSFATENGKVVSTDKRFTIWSSKTFWLIVLVCPLLLVGALYFLYHSVIAPHGQTKLSGKFRGPAAAMAQAVSTDAPVQVKPPVAVPPGMQFGGEGKGLLSPWRIVGSVSMSHRGFAVVRRAGFPLRYIELGYCLLSFGQVVSCSYRGEVFEPESGGPSSADGDAAGPSTWGPDVLAAKAVKGSH